MIVKANIIVDVKPPLNELLKYFYELGQWKFKSSRNGGSEENIDFVRETIVEDPTILISRRL